MQKFVKRINMFVAILIAAVVLVGCNVPGNNNQDEVKITISGLQEAYTFNTGDAFNEDILLQGVTIADQNGKNYLQNVEIKGIQAIPLNEDGTLKQAGTHTLRLNVVVDGKTVSTKMITVEVKFVMVETNDIIYNGDFALGTVDPFTVDNFEDGDGSISVVDNELVLTIKGLAYSAASPRLTYGAVDSETCFELEDGKYYEVSFDARASVSRHIHVQVGQLFAAAPWFADALRVQQYFLLDTTMQSYSFRFQADSSLADITKLSLMFGHGKLPDGYISEVCDVIYDNIKIVEVDNLGADTMAPSISASDKSVYVGTPVDVLALATISDDQDANPEVTVEIKKDGAVVDAIDTSVAGVYNIKYTAKDVAGNESSKEIVLTIKDKPTTSMPIENGEEAASVANGGWIEWHDQNWVGSNVAVSEALVGPSELKLSFQYTSGTNWFGMQLFYTDAAIPAGAINIVMDINSTAAGKVTIAGQVVELAVGDNHLEIAGATSATGATLSWQFGDASESTNIAGATIVVSSLSINEKVIIGETESYFAVTEAVFGSESDSKEANLGKWNVWYVQDASWNCGDVVPASFELVDGVLSYNFNNATNTNFWAVQLFYTTELLPAGSYKLSLNLNASKAMAITLCGNVIELTEGDNKIELDIELVNDGNWTFTFQAGTVDGGPVYGEAVLKFSDVSLTAVAVDTPVVPEPEQPKEYETESSLQAPTSVVWGGESDAVVGNWTVWNVQDAGWNCGPVVNVAYDLTDGILTVTSDVVEGAYWFCTQLFLKSDLAAGNYKLVLNINSSAARRITVNGNAYDLVAGDNELVIEVAYAGGTLVSLQINVEGEAVVAGSYTYKITSIAAYAEKAAEEEDTPVVPEDNQPINIDASLTKVEGAGIMIYLADKPAITLEELTITIISFESVQFAGYAEAILAGATKVHYIAETGYFYATVSNGFPNDSDITMVVNVSYELNGVTYSQNITFVGNVYQA